MSAEAEGEGNCAFKILLQFNKETYGLVPRDIIKRGGWNCAFIIIIGERLFRGRNFHEPVGWLPARRRNRNGVSEGNGD